MKYFISAPVDHIGVNGISLYLWALKFNFEPSCTSSLKVAFRAWESEIPKKFVLNTRRTYYTTPIKIIFSEIVSFLSYP